MKLYTGGTFDLFHVGHMMFLQRCRDIADQVCIGLNTDAFVQRFKGTAPVMDYEEREAILLGSRYVDIVIPNEGCEDSKPAILAARPHIIAIGSDWAPPRDYYAQMGFDQAWLDTRRIMLVFIPYTQEISSTHIRKRIEDGQQRIEPNPGSTVTEPSG